MPGTPRAGAPADKVAAQQRFAAGQPYLVDAEGGRHTDEVSDFLEGEQRGAVHEDHVLGHAVGAAQIAAVGDTDAQVVMLAAEGIDQLAAHGTPQVYRFSLSF